MGKNFRLGKIVDRYKLDVFTIKSSLENRSTDSAEAVDGDFSIFIFIVTTTFILPSLRARRSNLIKDGGFKGLLRRARNDEWRQCRARNDGSRFTMTK